MGLFSGIKDFVTGEKAAKRQERAAQQAAEAARFRPLNIGIGPGGLFGAQFQFDGDDVTGVTGTAGQPGVVQAQEALAAGLPGLLQQRGLDPRLANIGAGTAIAGARRLVPQDVFGAARQELGLFDRLRQPGREAQREELNARLLAQGRLGSTAGGEVEAALERQFEQQRAADTLSALQNARAQQAQQQQLGLAQLGLGSQLLSNQQAVRQGLFGQSLQDLLALQSAALQPIQLGGQLGSAQSAAGANIGSFLTSGAQAANAQRLSGPGLLAGFAQGAGQAAFGGGG